VKTRPWLAPLLSLIIIPSLLLAISYLRLSEWISFCAFFGALILGSWAAIRLFIAILVTRDRAARARRDERQITLGKQ
jgi:hypothetical protein